MENKGFEIDAADSEKFRQAVKKAQGGDKESMEKIIDLFTHDIEYLSRFIMLPREEAMQTLKSELISIVQEQL